MNLIKKENDLIYLNLLYEIHIAKDKIDCFSKKYNQDFKSFSEYVNNLSQEDFEVWDDFLEWKAYEQSLFESQKQVENLNGNN